MAGKAMKMHIHIDSAFCTYEHRTHIHTHLGWWCFSFWIIIFSYYFCYFNIVLLFDVAWRNMALLLCGVLSLFLYLSHANINILVQILFATKVFLTRRWFWILDSYLCLARLHLNFHCCFTGNAAAAVVSSYFIFFSLLSSFYFDV